ncbi:MAG: DUF3189 family protein [Firmicutes bacterium]|jgi:hypothetical protein|nr:DUF3189 family protein [Bacillota bacterium]
MWIIYHGYHQISTPLLAALVHQYLFSLMSDGSKVAETLSNNDGVSLEDTIYQSWQKYIAGEPLATLSFVGVDCHGNKIFILERRRFFTILKRTIEAGLLIAHNKEPVHWVDTSSCTNFQLELGIWLLQHSIESRRTYFDPTSTYVSYQQAVLRGGENFTRRGIKQAVPGICDLVQRETSC